MKRVAGSQKSKYINIKRWQNQMVGTWLAEEGATEVRVRSDVMALLFH